MVDLFEHVHSLANALDIGMLAAGLLALARRARRRDLTGRWAGAGAVFQ